MTDKVIAHQATRIFASGFFIASIILTGCAPLQTDALLRAEDIYPTRNELVNVPFYAQEKYQCGPASLAIMLQSAKVPVLPDELVSQVYLPDKEGSLQIEMLAAARRHGVIPYVLNKKMEAVLMEVQAGHPVLVLQNLGLSWLPSWHYAVVVGFDLQDAEMILRSGVEQRHVVPMKVFERTWARSDYWAVVMLPADTLPKTAEENRYLESVAALERLKKYEITRIAYNTALSQWPNSLAANMGLGNSYYALNEYELARETFQKITAFYPNAADAYNNLADTLGQLKHYDEAIIAVKHAIEIGGDHKDVYLQTLKEITQRSNNNEKGE